MMKSKKGGLMVMLGVLIVLFILGVCYLVLTPAYSKMKSAVTPLINETYNPTLDKIDNAWNNWPIIALLVLFVAGFILTANLNQSSAL